MGHHRNRILGGVLLIAGTTIGAGMLALPVSTGIAGFIPSLALFLVYWIYMTYTAFLFLEVNLWFHGDINLVTMAERTLGYVGKGLAWVFYLFLLYALTTAYLAIGGPIFVDILHWITGKNVPGWVGPIPLLTIFGYFVYRGTKYVDVMNRLMMVGLAITFLIIVFELGPNIEMRNLEYADWQYLPLAVSLVATSFGFHIIIPSLTTYLHHNTRKLKLTILLGSCIPVLSYILWNFVVLGNISVEGEGGLLNAFREGVSGSQLLGEVNHGSFMLQYSIRALAFFVIITSFLGVSMSLLDFLADGTGIHKTRKGRLFLICLTFGPPLFFALNFVRVFFTALEIAGAFGVVTLLGLLPACMVWWGRYKHHYHCDFKTPGGKPALIATMVFSLAVILIELGNKMGWIQL